MMVKVPLPVFLAHIKPEMDDVNYRGFVNVYHRASYLDFEHFCRIQPEMMISAPYLQYALWWKGLAKLPCLKERKQPVQWLRENLKAEIIDKGIAEAAELCVDRYAEGCKELGIQ